jgi:hypothetical protein
MPYEKRGTFGTMADKCAEFEVGINSKCVLFRISNSR